MSPCPGRDTLPLSDLPIGASARVLALDLDAREIEWLRAIGIAAGQRVTLLRRALFGGPLHVRTESGGEFAIDRVLAAAVRVGYELAEAAE